MTRSKKQQIGIITAEKIIIILTILLSLIIPSLLLIGNVKNDLYDKKIYEREFARVGSYERLSKEVVDNKTEAILNYFRNDYNLDDFFSEREKLHMADVKELIHTLNIFYYFLIIVTILALILLHKYAGVCKKDFLTQVSYSFIFSFFLIIVVALIFSLINFQSLFIAFHKIFFQNELWILPAESNLIKMFPEDFFRNFMIQIIKETIISSLMLAVLGGAIISLKKIRSGLPS